MLNSRNSLLTVAGIGDTFGEKYPDPPLASLPTGNATGVAFSPDGNAVIITHDTSPFITAYSWSPAGFGSRYSNPTVLPTGGPVSPVFTPSGSHVISKEVQFSVHRLIAYQWSLSTGFGAKQSIDFSGILPRSLAMSPDGAHVAMVGTSLATLKPLQVRPWTGSAFGSTVVTIPDTIASDDALAVAFSPSGGHVLITCAAEGTRAYPFSGGALGSPAIAPGTIINGRSIAFNSAGNYVAISRFITGQRGRVEIAGWSDSGFGSLVDGGNVAPFLVGGANSVRFSPNNLIAVGNGDNLYPLNVYRWSGTSIRHRLADPLILPTGAVPLSRAIAFSPSGDAMVVGHANPPFVTAYKITTN